MELLISLAFLLIWFIATIIYYNHRRNRNKSHCIATKRLSPIRELESSEVEIFRNFYKKDIGENTKVFNIKGSIDEFRTTSQGRSSSEYSINRVKIHPRSIKILSKNENGFDISSSELPEAVITKMKKLNDQFENNEIKESDYAFAVQELSKTDVEFVFLDNNKIHKPVYIVGFNDWKLSNIKTITS